NTDEHSREDLRPLRDGEERRNRSGARAGQADRRHARRDHRGRRHAGRWGHLLHSTSGALTGVSAQILLVDDEVNIRRMLGALLREEGMVVTEAANGNAALLMIKDVDPDVVLLDLLMPPGPDGLETLIRIREQGRSTPVIMMSGKAQLNDAVRAVKLGAFQFLEKPLTPEAVLVTLRSALELTRTQPENRALRSQLKRPRVERSGGTPEMTRARGAIGAAARDD